MVEVAVYLIIVSLAHGTRATAGGNPCPVIQIDANNIGTNFIPKHPPFTPNISSLRRVGLLTVKGYLSSNCQVWSSPPFYSAHRANCTEVAAFVGLRG